ncbi:PiggyBac transposable element-derived protein 4 [Elysia marginata]|uniref:PiggyBac transposable element-derived protein 4 n=1 Tax=Elysia marginata TaxID=1093978 RepID=A0AAV4JJ07_9GAST|nr:PiggyBac transposable element-derived protein 4 [Elysia marginata]
MHSNVVSTLVGTVRSDKRFLPQKFAGKKELQLYESAFGFQDSRMICSYQGHRPKNVILVSSMHGDAAIDLSNEKQKPEVVLFYNRTKGGVDTMDKMALTYTTKRSTKRWPLVLFFNLLDLSTVASRVIFQLKNPGHSLVKRDARADFIRDVSKP